MNELLFKRIHPVLSERQAQIELNLLALRGGKPYVFKRLWRQSNESDLSWFGTKRLDAYSGGDSGAVGRKERARCQNDAGRIAIKIEQYLFSEDVSRDGVTPEFQEDCGGGRSITRFWQDVSELVTAQGWCWLQADRAAPLVDLVTGKARPRTLAERERDSDKAVWRVWPAQSVVDWRKRDGKLLWLICEEEREISDDPEVEAKTEKVRTLWKRGGVGATFQRMAINAGVVRLLSEGTVSSPEIPFVCVGNPSSSPWWYDDVEAIQAQLLNLDSLHNENLSRAVFPQLVVPVSVVANLEARLVEAGANANGEAIMELQREILRGADRPIVEDAEGNGITRYICPSASELEALPDEIGRKRGLLFDSVGMALFNRESRQIQTAESKQWDHLDTEATLCTRSKVLEDAETSLVRVTMAIDSTFTEYEPNWPQSFNVVDIDNMTGALVELANLPLTLTQRKILLKGATRLLSEVVSIDEDEKAAILDEIAELQELTFELPTPEPFDETA